MYNNYNEHIIVTAAVSICPSITLQISRAKPGHQREGGRKGWTRWREGGYCKWEGVRGRERGSE